MTRFAGEAEPSPAQMNVVPSPSLFFLSSCSSLSFLSLVSSSAFSFRKNGHDQERKILLKKRTKKRNVLERRRKKRKKPNWSPHPTKFSSTDGNQSVRSFTKSVADITWRPITEIFRPKPSARWRIRAPPSSLPSSLRLIMLNVAIVIFIGLRNSSRRPESGLKDHVGASNTDGR